MTRAPLPSMHEGGLSWFTDLCVPDPYYILPLISSTTLMLLLYRSSKMMPMSKTVKNTVVVVIPSLTFLFVKGFPAVSEQIFLIIYFYINLIKDYSNN